MVEFDGGLLASVIWDAGLGTERIIPGGFLGPTLFSVPPGATVGSHPVAIQTPNGRRSNIMAFNVTTPVPFVAPRIERVMSLGSSFDANGNINSWLYVQGANLDVGAVLQVDGVDVATVAHKALRNDLFGVNPTQLGYPIYHYVSVLAVPTARPAGATIAIIARNLDGQTSPSVNYTLAANAANVDSDGDGLLDTWEINGFDANGDGTVDIDLAALGCTTLRPDLLLEVDVMNSLTNPPIATAGNVLGTFAATQQMFLAAPLVNPLDNGINLIIDSSGTVPFWSVVDFNVTDNATLGIANFGTLKAANFNAATRGNIYHYAIWGNARANGTSGISDVNFTAGTGGDDLIVSFDDFPAAFQTIRSQVETLAHEFGHNLGQRHGGDNHTTKKPNYWSVMGYTWQLRTGGANATRRREITCPPVYYASAGAAEPNGALPATINSVVDYSEGMARSLVENNNSLSETVGVCGLAVDWNDDSDMTDTGINADVDDNGSSNTTVNDFANWRALVFTGPVNNGTVP